MPTQEQWKHLEEQVEQDQTPRRALELIITLAETRHVDAFELIDRMARDTLDRWYG